MKLLQEFESGKLFKKDSIYVLDLEGDWGAMGRQYGHLMKSFLEKRFEYLMGVYPHPSDEAIEKGLKRYIPSMRELIEGAVETSGMPISALGILDYSRLLDMLKAFNLATNNPGCSFIAVSKDYTPSGNVVLGRNLDWLCGAINPEVEPIVLVIYRPKAGHSVCSIGFPGWFCPVTAFSDQHLLWEGNSGRLSVGNIFLYDQISYETHALEMLSESSSLSELSNYAENMPVDEGIIANIADKDDMLSLESAPKAVRVRHPESDTYYRDAKHAGLLVATNSFRLPGWESLVEEGHDPYPEKGKIPSKSTIRYDNLVSQALIHRGQIDLAAMKEIMSIPIESGGALELPDSKAHNIDYTYISVVADMGTMEISVCSPIEKTGWIDFILKDLFAKKF